MRNEAFGTVSFHLFIYKVRKFNFPSVIFTIPGKPGHGSLLLENTAGEKLQKLLNKFYEFRDSQLKKLNDNSELSIGDVTTVNTTVSKTNLK